MRSCWRAPRLPDAAKPTSEALALGAVVNFFDTFGIGSFAQTTAWMKFRKMVPDRLIPPTMIAGLTPPAMVESIIFLILLGVRVDPVLLFGGAIATGVGGVVGAPLVVRARAWIVQMTVAIGLLLAGIAFVLAIAGKLPVGGTASGLPMGLTIIAIARELRLRAARQFRGRQLRPDAGDPEPDGHGPALLLPDHGVGRVANGRRIEHQLHQGAGDRPSDRGRADARRDPGGAGGGADRQVDERRPAPLCDHFGRVLYGRR